MATQLMPRNDRVIVRPDEEETTSSGGIVLAPSANKEKPQRGEVMAVGPGKRLESGDVVAMDIKVGDKVLYGKYAGTEIKVDGDDMMVLREDDIMAIVKNA